LHIVENAIETITHRLGLSVTRYGTFPKDFAAEDISIIRSVEPYTMSNRERIYSLIQAVKYITKGNVIGDVVECGVWKGGSMMAVANTLLTQRDSHRHLYLFDTFEGMPEPDTVDVSVFSGEASTRFAAMKTGESSSTWACVSLDEVKKSMYSTGYPVTKMHFVKGLVEETIPKEAPAHISLLRLDTDFYSSTHHELIHLFPRLSRGGVIIFDDYASWLGSRKATDEYIAENGIAILLQRTDTAGARLGIKV
jgi:O-methyltransferase